MKRVVKYYTGNLLVLFLFSLFIDCGAEQGVHFLINMIVVTSTFFAVLRGRDVFRKHISAVAISLFSFLLIGILLFRLVDQERGGGGDPFDPGGFSHFCIRIFLQGAGHTVSAYVGSHAVAAFALGPSWNWLILSRFKLFEPVCRIRAGKEEQSKCVV